MGEEIKSSQFGEEDFREFESRLRTETRFLKDLFDQNQFRPVKPMAGFELETWLVNKNLTPAPVNEEFLKIVKNPAVVHELSRFNIELNSSPYECEGKVLTHLFKELAAMWKECQWAGEKVGAEMMCVGILPTLRQEMLSLANMSQSERYLALNEQIFRQRGGEPLHLDIHGTEHLKLTHPNVMLEATATSLQIHVNLQPEQALRAYNASIALSAPMIGLTANSPYLFGKELWEETRIPVFEQAVSLNYFPDSENYPVGRVSLGSGYLKKSFFEAFQENLERYPPLLPILFDSPPEEMRHLRLHNGTIWRWNRPLIGGNPKEGHYLRLEHRVAPSGPSLKDVIANLGFFMGALDQLAGDKNFPADKLPFHHCRENLYQAAKLGLSASIVWEGGKRVKIRDLLANELIPMAREGLKNLWVHPEDIDQYLNRIILPRVQSGQNGAQWQKLALKKYKGDFHAMTAAYLEHQRIGFPVHEWSL